MAALLAVVMSLPASDARTHRRHHAYRQAPGATETQQQQPTQQPRQQSPARAEGEGSASPAVGANAGKVGVSAATLAPGAIETILGKSVRSSAGEDMGRLVDVLVGSSGRPRAAIIDFGGFLGVGSRKIAVDWSALKFAPRDPKGNLITVQLTRDQVKSAPEFKDGSAVVVLGAANVTTGAPATQTAPPQTQEK